MSDKPILNIEEIASLTGLSKNTIYNLKARNEIPCFKFGPRLLRFKRDEILSWMENRQYIPLKQALADRKAAKVEVQ